MRYLIYEIRHNQSGKIYIGKHQTCNIDDGYFGSGKYLKRAIKRYGIDAFTKTILFDFSTEEEMNAKEKELVTEDFCQRKDTYNICEGGKGGWSYINRTGKNMYGRNKENYIALSILGRQKFKQYLEDPEFRSKFLKKCSEQLIEHYKINKHQWIGRNHTEETKRKIGASNAKQIGDKNGRFGTCWITNGIENKIIKKTDHIPDGWSRGRTVKK
jgi:hypothetical protein